MKRKKREYERHEEGRKNVSEHEKEWLVWGERRRSCVERRHEGRGEGQRRKKIGVVQEQLKEKEKHKRVGNVVKKGREIKHVPQHTLKLHHLRFVSHATLQSQTHFKGTIHLFSVAFLCTQHRQAVVALCQEGCEGSPAGGSEEQIV